MPLGIEGTAYQRGYDGKPFPKYMRKDGPLWTWYKLGKADKKAGKPTRVAHPSSNELKLKRKNGQKQ